MSKNKRRKQSKDFTKREISEEMEFGNTFQPTNKSAIEQIQIRTQCKTENQKKFLKLINDKEIVICSGAAGVGKTFLAISEALKLLKSNQNSYKKIVLLKSVTQLKGEELGFLKGNVAEKISPFVYSFMAIFHKLIGKKLSELLEEQGFIEVLPIAFLRGLSIDSALIILDEAQNVSIDNMRTILTRIGYNSKIIVIGDTKQIDIKNKKESALFAISEKFKSFNEFGVMEFEKTDQVRNPLINKIEDMFDLLNAERS